MAYVLNTEQPVKVAETYLSWQILDENKNLVCDFRGPQSMMCCMAALERMNNPSYSMSQAMDLYRIEKGGYI